MLQKIKLILMIPNIGFSLLVGICVFIFSNFFQSDEWESSMILSIGNIEKAEAITPIDMNPFANTNDNSLKIESYLLSNEGITKTLQYAKKIGGDNIIAPNKLDILKNFKSEKEILRDLISISRIEESNMLSIQARAFDPQAARIINLSLINLSINFFDTQKSLKSQLNYANNLCILSFLVDEYSQIDSTISAISLAELQKNQTIGSRELLKKVYSKYAESCASQKNSNSNGIGQLSSLPSGLLESLDADFKSQTIQEIYNDYNQNFQQRNMVEIIADPDLPLDRMPKRSIILMIISILITSLSIISFKGLLQIWKDYS